MAERRKYRCRNCGFRFEADVLTEREERESRRRKEPVSPVACPRCFRHRDALVPGWD